MKKTKAGQDEYAPDLHAILIQTTDLSLYEKVTKKDIIEVLRVRKLPRSVFDLKMNRITTIEPIVAKWLENSHFETIELHGVKKIEDKALTYLAKSLCMLELGLTNLTPQQASILVKYHRSALTFKHLKKISIATAKVLKNYRGNILEFPAISSIDPEAFKELASFQGEFLTIGDLQQKVIYNS